MQSCWHRFDTEQLLHRGALPEWLSYREAGTQEVLYTRKLLHRAAFTQRTRRSLDTEKLVHTEALTQRSLLHKEDCTQRRFCAQKLLEWETFA